MYVIAVTNQKGGVAKTTTAINLAVGLAMVESQIHPTNPPRVLFLALDPQGDGALIMGGQFVRTDGTPSEETKPDYHIGDLLIEDEPPPPSRVIRNACLPTFLARRNLDYVPISPSKQALLQNQIVNIEMREQRLAMFLDLVGSIYKYVIVDTPPNVGLMTMNALFAATHFLVPMIPNGAGLRFLQDLLITIGRIQKKYNPNLRMLGILPSKCVMSRNETRLALDILNQNFDGQVFAPIIERSEISQSYSSGLDIFSFRSSIRKGKVVFTESEAVNEMGGFVSEVYRRLNGGAGQ